MYETIYYSHTQERVGASMLLSETLISSWCSQPMGICWIRGCHQGSVGFHGTLKQSDFQSCWAVVFMPCAASLSVLTSCPASAFLLNKLWTLAKWQWHSDLFATFAVSALLSWLPGADELSCPQSTFLAFCKWPLVVDGHVCVAVRSVTFQPTLIQ